MPTLQDPDQNYPLVHGDLINQVCTLQYFPPDPHTQGLDDISWRMSQI